MKLPLLTYTLTLAFAILPLSPTWALDRDFLYRLGTNNFESLYQPFDKTFAKRQDEIFEAIRTANYENFARHANSDYPNRECEISEAEFKKLVKELSYFADKSFRRLHGVPKNITPDGLEAFITNASERGAWSLRKLSAVQSDLVIYRTYLTKLEGNKNCGWVHVFYDKKTLNVKSIFINRGVSKRAFNLPDPDPTLPLHQGKDFLK